MHTQAEVKLKSIIYDKLIDNRASKHLKVLDVGCGDGSLYDYIHSNYQDIQVEHFGVDIKKSGPDYQNYSYMSADIDGESLPYADNCFDLLYCSHVIEHLRDPLRLVDEMLRVCKPDGLVVIRAPSERSLRNDYFALNQSRYFIGNFFDDPTHIGRPWSPQSLLRLGIYYSCEVLLSEYNKSLMHWLIYPFVYLYGVLFNKTDLMVEYYWKKIGWESIVVYKKVTHAAQMNYFSFKGIRGKCGVYR